jgi:hypothetical protein
VPEPSAVELRVHGVGGAVPEGLLGMQSRAETARVAGGGLTSFWARRDDPSVEGYFWGRLSTGDPLQPLWVFLLPFTLVNLAGWMHQPDGEGGAGLLRHVIHRLIVRVLGITLTMSSVVWLMIMGVDLAAWQWGRELTDDLPPGLAWLGAGGTRIAIGGALVLGILWLTSRIARTTQSSFEAIKGPEERPAAAARAQTPPSRTGTLTDPKFWERRDDVDRLLRWHQLAALATWALCMVQAAIFAAAGWATLGLGTGIILVGGVQIGLLIFLLGHDLVDLYGKVRRTRVLAASGASPDRWPRPADGFRWLAPTVLATCGLALSNAAFAGWEQLLAKFMGHVAVVRTGMELALVDVMGLAVLVAIVALIVMLIRTLPAPRTEVAAVAASGPLNESRPGRPLTGLPIGWRKDGTPDLGPVKSVVRARHQTRLLRNVDLVLTPPMLVFIVVAVIAGATRLETMADWAPGAPLAWLPAMDPYEHAIPLLPAGAERWLAGFSSWLLLTGTGLAVALLRALVTKPASRQLVGTLWDVITFWPRRYHPLAVRPYAEKAVPELQHRIAYHVGQGRPVVLAAHSQGSVLAAAALLSRPSLADGVALVTVGSPLAQLYARFYPAYFGPDGQFAALRTRLSAANPGLGADAWRSFYRLTDYIGQRVHGPAPDQGDVEVADPAERTDDVPDPVVRPDQIRLGWSELDRHSFYWNEPAVQHHLAALRARLANPAQAPTPAPAPSSASVTQEA